MKLSEIDYTKMARSIEKKVGAYIHPNQIKRYLYNHPELDGKRYEDIYRQVYKIFLNRHGDD